MASLIQSLCCAIQNPDATAPSPKKGLSYDFALAAIVVLTATLLTVGAAQGFGVFHFSAWGTIGVYSIGSGLILGSFGLIVADRFCCRKTVDEELIFSESEEVSVVVPEAKEESAPMERPRSRSSSEEPNQPKSSAITLAEAATRIQRAWKTQRYRFKEEDLQGPIGGWITEHFKDFLAHDVHPIYEKKVLEEGEVKPPEMLFRETFAVDYLFSGINRIDFSQLDIEIIKKINGLPLHYRFDTSDAKYPMEYDATTYLEKVEEYKKNVKALNEDQKEASLEELKKWAPSPITIDVEKENAFYQQCSEIAKMEEKLKKREKILKIMKDQLLPDNRRVDVLLSHHFKNLGDTGMRFSKATEICGQLRAAVLDDGHIDYEISASKSDVSWYFAYIVVLKTSQSRIIGREDGSRVCLLAPFHNDGKFFTLKLQDADTILLGPRSKLEVYEKMYNVIYIEDLTPRQANFFNIPHRLDKEYNRKLEVSKSQRIAKDYNPLYHLQKRDRNWQII